MILLTLSACSSSEVSEQSSEVIITNEAGERVYKDGLTVYEFRWYLGWYHIDAGMRNANITYDSEITPEATIQTEMVVRLLNYLVWDHDYETADPGDIELKNDHLTARKIMEEYGFSTENRLTLEWVMSNPYDAYQMKLQIPEVISYYSTTRPKRGCEYYEIDISDLYGESNTLPYYVF